MSSLEAFKLLLVEDNPGDIDLVRERLSNVPGYDLELTCVTNLREAVGALQQSRMDAVLLDLSLPDSTGIETLRRLRQVREDVAIVVLSGHSSEEWRRAALREGAQDFISKNEQPAVLLARIMPSALERHRAQEQHRQVERLVSATSDAVVVTDLKGIIQFTNQAALALFGKPAGQSLVGQPLDYDAYEGEVTQIQIPGSDGVRFAEMRVVSCEWARNPALLVSIRDMTQQVKLNEQLRQAQKMEAVGLLAGGIAHDFNNLILAILFNAEFLRTRIAETDPAWAVVDEIVQAVDQAKSLTSQLLTFSRRKTVSFTPVDLAPVIVKTVAMLKRIIPENIALETDIPENVWPVLADAGQIDQVVFNLVLNAKDAMPSGGRLLIELHDRTLDQSDGDLPAGDYVCLTVSDNGSGIAPEIVERIFEPFFTTKEVGKGTGLGLATCYGIVQQAQGRIDVSSTLGTGTTFTVLLPRTRVTPLATAMAFEEIEKSRAPATILIVEDNLSVRQSVLRALEEHGYMVLAASNGREALQVVKFHGRSVDLVVSDVVMPNMNGYELADILAENQPNLRVLLTTGYSEYLSAGGFRRPDRPMFLKPYSPQELVARIHEMLASNEPAADAPSPTQTKPGSGVA